MNGIGWTLLVDEAIAVPIDLKLLLACRCRFADDWHDCAITMITADSFVALS